MNLAYKKILGKFTKVLGIGKTPPYWEKFPNNPVSFFYCLPKTFQIAILLRTLSSPRTLPLSCSSGQSLEWALHREREKGHYLGGARHTDIPTFRSNSPPQASLYMQDASVLKLSIIINFLMLFEGRIVKYWPTSWQSHYEIASFVR